MFDERFDKRYDGYQADSFALDFWMYRVKSEEGMEYYLLSEKELPNQVCNFTGMEIPMDDSTEVTKNMKLKKLTRLFFVKDVESDVKILPKEELIELVKNKKTNLEEWLSHLAQHPQGTINQFPIETELLRSAWVLSGKVDGWPLHLAILGPAGTKKTMGHIEVLDSKFNETPKIAASTMYRLKGLIPSFKGTICDIGYLARCNRIAFIDEIGKMVEAESHKHDGSNRNILGEFNELLEHKKRFAGSGNANDIPIQATAKYLFVTNPVAGKPTLPAHVGLIDPTTMSRIFWYVQDLEEQKFVRSAAGVLRNPPETMLRTSDNGESSPYTMLSIYTLINDKKEVLLKKCRGDYYSINEFLTVFDSCYNFVCDIDDDEVERLIESTVALAREPMKSLWESRAYHHIKLVIDGLCKTRCLFDDYDASFKAKQQDYDWAERILVRMVKSWDTILTGQEEGYQ